MEGYVDLVWGVGEWGVGHFGMDQSKGQLFSVAGWQHTPSALTDFLLSPRERVFWNSLPSSRLGPALLPYSQQTVTASPAISVSIPRDPPPSLHALHLPSRAEASCFWLPFLLTPHLGLPILSGLHPQGPHVHCWTASLHFSTHPSQQACPYTP